MPLYEVTHSYPLEPSQKADLAARITKIHSHQFLTPSIFVHVQFRSQDASAGNYFIAGKVQNECVNRIQGMLRTGEKRSKADFDKTTEMIEKAWYDVLYGIDEDEDEEKKKEKQKKGKEETEGDKLAKKLRFVTIYPMVTAREVGSIIPTAGEEKAWFKEYKSQFEKEADAGNKEIEEMLKEIEDREDLKKVWG